MAAALPAVPRAGIRNPCARGGAGQLSSQSQAIVHKLACVLRPHLPGVLEALQWDKRLRLNTAVARLTGVSRQCINTQAAWDAFISNFSIFISYKGIRPHIFLQAQLS